MAPEILYLALSSALLVAQLLIAVGPRTMTYGIGWAAGPRDQAHGAPSMRAERAERACRNMQETFPVLVALALGLVVAERTSAVTAAAIQVYFWARVIYVPAYIFHVPFLRSTVWAIATGALGVLFLALVLPSVLA